MENQKISQEESNSRNELLSEFFSEEYFDERLKDRHVWSQKAAYDYDYKMDSSIHYQIHKTQPEDFRKLYNSIYLYERHLVGYIRFTLYAKEMAEQLITEIQKEYHLEKE